MSKFVFIFIFIIFTGLMTSCGKSEKKINTNIKSEQVYLEQEDEGLYRAELKTLNSALFPDARGSVEIHIEGEEVIVNAQAQGVDSGVKHFQNIMSLNKCPTLADDANGDGIVDMIEAMTTTGSILLPLDSDLTNQLKGSDFGPIGNNSRQYVYRRSVTLTDLLSDLRAPDPDPFDSVVKLPFGRNLNLAGRVILIHGVKELPDSHQVNSYPKYTNEESIPIACGEIKRINIK